MLAKLTSKNQLTLPKSVTDRLGPVQYFEVQLQAGQVLLTPVRIQRGDAVRAKLAELELGEDVIARALDAARSPAKPTAKTPRASTASRTSPVKTRTPATAGVARVDKSVGKQVDKSVGKSVAKKATAARKPVAKPADAAPAKKSTAAAKPARKAPAKVASKTPRQKSAPAA